MFFYRAWAGNEERFPQSEVYGPQIFVSQVSISTKFYKQLFCTKVFCAAFRYLLFGFVIFGRKNISSKAARKMLLKLTTVLQLSLGLCITSHPHPRGLSHPQPLLFGIVCSQFLEAKILTSHSVSGDNFELSKKLFIYSFI